MSASRRRDADELDAALNLAADYDRKVVVEAAVPNAREIECAVLGNDAPEASVPGEIVPSREFYDYEAKYLDEGSSRSIPADLTAAQLADVQRLSKAAFLAIDGAGLAGSTSSSAATTDACTSTRSTRCPASRRSACTPSCGKPAA